MFLPKEDYLSKKEKQEIRLKGLVEKFKAEGLDEKEAVNKARVVMYKPDKLAKQSFYEAKKKAGIRPSVCFFFDNQAEVMYLRKFFQINISSQVKNCNKLLKILKFYEDNKVKPETKIVAEPQVKPEAVPIKVFRDISDKKQLTLGGFDG